ncbi:hypothetical protein OROMI_016297 [Orobanche minor]
MNSFQTDAAEENAAEESEGEEEEAGPTESGEEEESREEEVPARVNPNMELKIGIERDRSRRRTKGIIIWELPQIQRPHSEVPEIYMLRCFEASRRCTDPNENAMWFEVNGEVIRFSKVEFALISGLRFGTSQFNPYQDHDIPETSLYTKLFKNEKITSIHS